MKRVTCYINYGTNIRNHLRYSHDENPIHDSPEHARLAWLSLHSIEKTGLLQSKLRSAEDIAKINAAMPSPFVIAPGALFSVFLENPNIIPNARNICYIRSDFKSPLAVVHESSAEVVFGVENKDSRYDITFLSEDVELGQTCAQTTLPGFTFDLFEEQFLVQPKSKVPDTNETSEHKGSLYKGAYQLGDKPVPFTRLFNPRVSVRDRELYLKSLELPDEESPVLTPLQVLGKLPRYVFLFLDELRQNEAYVRPVHKVFRRDEERIKLAENYVRMANEFSNITNDEQQVRSRVDDIILAPLVVFDGFEAYYDPRKEILVGEEFDLLMHYSPKSKRMRKKLVAEGFLHGERFMYAAIDIMLAPLVTKPVIGCHIDRLIRAKEDDKVVSIPSLDKLVDDAA